MVADDGLRPVTYLLASVYHSDVRGGKVDGGGVIRAWIRQDATALVRDGWF